MNSDGISQMASPSLFHPIVAEQKEITVQACKAADIEPQRLRKSRF